MATATLEEVQQLVEFLHAVGKQSMQSAGVEAYARRQRLKRILAEQLADPRNEVMRAVMNKLRALGLNGVTGEEVVAYFRGTKPPPPPPPPPPGDGYPLDELARRAAELATGRKPVSICFPDGTTRAVDERKKLVLAVIEWFGERLLPSPQPRWADSKRYLYHDQPFHERREMRNPQEIQVAGRRLFVDTWVSA